MEERMEGNVPRLVNFSDSDMSTGTDSDEEGKECPPIITSPLVPQTSEEPSKPQDFRCSGTMVGNLPGSSRHEKGCKDETREKVSDRRRSDVRTERISEGNGKSRRSRSRGKYRSRSRSRGKHRSGSRGRHRRSRSGSRGRHRKSRSGSRNKHKRSRSGSRGRRRRSRSGGRYKRRRHGSPRRFRRSPPRGAVVEGNTVPGVQPGVPQVAPEEPGLPSYYNRLAVNPTKIAQQLAKRKLIWGGKAADESTTNAASSAWQGATFSQDRDGKMTAKFKRLMGIKGDGGAAESENKGTTDLIKRQQELFSSMELQYEAARQATHTQRGVGLGFASHPHHFPSN